MRANNMQTRRRLRQGFTLVELLTVIAIIGILIGLIVPAVFVALKSVRQSVIALEVSTIAEAVNKYNDKYGGYPPDGTNGTIFQRHCRKVFPQIAASEFADLNFAAANNQGPMPWPTSAGPDPRVMDPTEALVFFLGGFSDDPVHPFTGSGGPIQITARDSMGNATAAQYNVDRNSPLYDFKQGQLSLEVVGGLTLSTDELLYGLALTNDALPVYRPPQLDAPYVYFDSRTYAFPIPGGRYANHFSPGGSSAATGYARPYKSNNVNTSIQYTPGTADRYYRYANEKTFQVISAGLDDSYGGVNPLTDGTKFYSFPSGQLIDVLIAPTAPQTGPLAYIEVQGQPSAQLDNATNFSEGVLKNRVE